MDDEGPNDSNSAYVDAGQVVATIDKLITFRNAYATAAFLASDMAETHVRSLVEEHFMTDGLVEDLCCESPFESDPVSDELANLYEHYFLNRL
eukprot:9506714-Heterocapsa_arctica.AAC.1